MVEVSETSIFGIAVFLKLVVSLPRTNADSEGAPGMAIIEKREYRVF